MRLNLYRIIAGLFLTVSGTAAQEVIVDNEGPGWSILSGSWTLTSSTPGYWGTNYRFATNGGAVREVEWRPTLPAAGDYEVAVWYTQGANRATNAPFTVTYNGGSTTVPVNQQINGSTWVVIGTFPFVAGTAGYTRLTNQANNSVVIADAVRYRVVQPPANEFRAMWVSRFEWPSTNPATAQNTINTIMALLAANNFNAVLFQVRGQADVLYPSPYEPWSPLIGGSNPGWDPLQFALDAAHANGLEFHAYINTHTCWQSSTATPPSNPAHLYWQHCNAANPNARDWLIHNDLGQAVQYEESDYVWIAPGVPAANAYTRQQIMYVVENYDVDGVHFDRIRTPGQEYSHDPISNARSAIGAEGNPDGLSFASWTRDQITRLCRDTYAEIQTVKPWVTVSSAPLGLYAQSAYPGYPPGFNYGFTFSYQDAIGWMNAGAMDFICPQIYWADGGALPNFSDILPHWVANSFGRHVYAGQITSVGIAELISEINITRASGAQGNTVFSYSSFNNNGYWDDYSVTGPYTEPAELPAMPWKDDPTDATIAGYIADAATGEPITDARIIRTGSAYRALSSSDGFYSFLKVPPGSYTLTVTKNCYSPRAVSGFSLTAGDAPIVEIGLLIGDADLNATVNEADLVLIRQNLDTLGTGNLDINCDGQRNLADIIRCRNYQGLSD